MNTVQTGWGITEHILFDFFNQYSISFHFSVLLQLAPDILDLLDVPVGMDQAFHIVWTGFA